MANDRAGISSLPLPPSGLAPRPLRIMVLPSINVAEKSQLRVKKRPAPAPTISAVIDDMFRQKFLRSVPGPNPRGPILTQPVHGMFLAIQVTTLGGVLQGPNWKTSQTVLFQRAIPADRLIQLVGPRSRQFVDVIGSSVPIGLAPGASAWSSSHELSITHYAMDKNFKFHSNTDGKTLQYPPGTMTVDFLECRDEPASGPVEVIRMASFGISVYLDIAPQSANVTQNMVTCHNQIRAQLSPEWFRGAKQFAPFQNLVLGIDPVINDTTGVRLWLSHRNTAPEKAPTWVPPCDVLD